ncbi:MAG: CehA/McbA family metallohydrolase [Thermomicrobiales bacterium]
MHSLPFGRPGRFYKGNLHTHSTHSDGKREPAEVIATYRDAGYDFIALTDHFLASYDFPIVDTRALRSEGFTTLIGAELHAPALGNGERWHILAVGLPFGFAPVAQAETGPQLAARAAAAGAYVAIAHPAWYGLTVEDALSLEAAHAVEVFNTTCRYEGDRGESWHLADLLLARGKRLLACATDDAHFAERPDQFGGWVMVRAERPEPELLLAALKAGHYYSSQGPDFTNIAVEGDEIRIESSPVREIYAVGRGSVNRRALGELTTATFPLEPFRKGGYCRVTLIDAAGKRAWSNPVWLD